MKQATCQTAILISSLLIIGTTAARGERLPVRMYTVADGLADNRVHRIVRDSRGFLWFCTSNGLSRFDGNSFVTYSVDNGLPFPSINDLLETKNHEYWLATNGGGVIHFDTKLQAGTSAPQLRFTVYSVGDKAVTNRVNTLYEDRIGRIWAGTDGGLFLMEASKGERTFRQVVIGLTSRPDEAVQVWAFLEDAESNLWIGSKFGLLRRLPDGRTIQYVVEPSQGSDSVYALLDDGAGQFWMGHQSGLLSFKFPVHSADAPNFRKQYSSTEGITRRRVMGLCRTKDGSLWIGTSDGVVAQVSGHFQSYWTGREAFALVEDQGGGIWAATAREGAIRLYRNGFTVYDEADGLDPPIRSMIGTPAGDMVLANGDFFVSQFARDRFTFSKPALPTGTTWRSHQIAIRDRYSDWWFATMQGLVRFRGVSSIEQLSRASGTTYTTRDGLASDDLTCVYEDSRGDIWVGHFAPGSESLTRWDRAQNRFQRYSSSDGLPAFNAPISFSEDRAGNIWIGFFGDGLARYRGGRFVTFTKADGMLGGGCRDIHLDRSGRIWAASSLGGLVRIDDPDSEHPRFVTYTVADGLTTNSTSYIAEDRQGRIYVTSYRAIDRVDVVTGKIKRYPVSEQLGITEFTSAYCDQQGALWFGTMRGLARLVTDADERARPSLVFIEGLRVAGIPHSISALGEKDVAELEFGSSQNRFQIDFSALDFSSGSALRYQYMLDGVDADWNPQTSNRTVTYAGLAPGAYRFLVEAIASDGTRSVSPASVSFRILAPFWRRWWFIAIAGLIICSAAFALARVRLARLKTLRESENRFRTLAETASDAIITIDESSTIVFVNLAAEKVFGYTRNEMLGGAANQPYARVPASLARSGPGAIPPIRRTPYLVGGGGTSRPAQGRSRDPA